MNGIPPEQKGYRLVTWKKEPPDSRSRTKVATLYMIAFLVCTVLAFIEFVALVQAILFISYGYDDIVSIFISGTLVALGMTFIAKSVSIVFGTITSSAKK